jgi:hypothetical protein
LSRYKRPELLLNELGIVVPDDIRIEGIAQYCGATIVYEPLTGCEAYIAGHGNRAIITVNANASSARRRFSAAHELGHWIRDRAQLAVACAERQFLAGWDDDDPERRANRYAADLLLPKFMFRPAARGRPCTFETVKALADPFETSLTATAIRLVEEGDLPSMLVYSDATGRRWFVPSAILPDGLWPHPKPGGGSIAHAILSGGSGARTGVVDASEWLSHPRAKDYEVNEDAMRVGDGVLSLLWWKDERMVIELDPDNDEETGEESGPSW